VRSGRRDRIITSPAKIELVRGGDNPWYELTLTEGRNRQIRKMFEEIGHHVEKIGVRSVQHPQHVRAGRCLTPQGLDGQ